GCAVLLVSINGRLAAVALATILPIFALLRVFVGRVSKLFGALQAALARLNGILQEDLQGLKVVRAFSGEEREAARYRRANGELRDLNLEVITSVANNFPFVNLCATLGTLAVVGFGGYQTLHARLTLGNLLPFQSS